MRMRSKPWTVEYLNSHPAHLIENPQEYKAQWRKLCPFPKLNVEIGCGKGDYWLSKAESAPEEGWIAIEKDRTCAAVALRKAEEHTLTNICLIIGDASELDLWFAPLELDALYLNFSDPWPKKRNTKRRLTHDSFLSKYASVLKEDGCLTLKTDNSRLFEYSLLSFNQDWLLKEVSIDFDSEANHDALTEYERRFKAEGVPIKRAVFQKR